VFPFGSAWVRDIPTLTRLYAFRTCSGNVVVTGCPPVAVDDGVAVSVTSVSALPGVPAGAVSVSASAAPLPPVNGFDANLPVTPAGRPETASVTEPLDPPKRPIVIPSWLLAAAVRLVSSQVSPLGCTPICGVGEPFWNARSSIASCSLPLTNSV
jgi:hypothetical protein